MRTPKPVVTFAVWKVAQHLGPTRWVGGYATEAEARERLAVERRLGVKHLMVARITTEFLPAPKAKGGRSRGR